jgi:hypothetical protein|uniref:Uncharacterized protein n=1 Tax=Oryza sativa subsp. japonica TaxID=39947 RepID=Q6ZFB2_ORYSJ|nr:hypothetical protein [Oryza sativa Japonica Group]
MDSLIVFMKKSLEIQPSRMRSRYWKTPVKPKTPAKKEEKLAQKKPPPIPRTKKVWRAKQKTPTPSPPETGEKSVK